MRVVRSAHRDVAGLELIFKFLGQFSEFVALVCRVAGGIGSSVLGRLPLLRVAATNCLA